MIAVFFKMLWRSIRRVEMRWWVYAWSATFGAEVAQGVLALRYGTAASNTPVTTRPARFTCTKILYSPDSGNP